MAFLVQRAVHADPVSTHASEADAVRAIHELAAAGLAEAGEFNVVELDPAGEPVRIVDVEVDDRGLGSSPASSGR